MAANVILWNEYLHEREHEAVGKLYPQGIHGAIQATLEAQAAPGQFSISSATLEEPEHGLSEERLDAAHVLFWWGHKAHKAVEDAVVERVLRRVHEGMGLVVLHSGHFSKVFRRLMGTPCTLKWREAGERERLWVTRPGHPIARGLPPSFELPHTEMYGEPFAIPEPEEQVFLSWFEGGEVFRSGCCWRRGQGKIFYFRPGHETYPIYHDANVQRVLYNAACWALPDGHWQDTHRCPNVPAEAAHEQLVPYGESVH